MSLSFQGPRQQLKHQLMALVLYPLSKHIPFDNILAPGGASSLVNHVDAAPVISQLPAVATVMQIFVLATTHTLEIAAKWGRVASELQK